jgi:hypothetical protein
MSRCCIQDAQIAALHALASGPHGAHATCGQ